MRTSLFAIALLVVLGGCSLAPRYQRPGLPVPETLPATGTASAADAAAPLTTSWKNTFTDPKLQTVIERAIASNRDLHIAALNAERAAAMFRIQRGELYPGLGIQASGNRYRLPEKMASDGNAKTIGEYSVMVGVPTWELDLFGRLGSLRDAALHQYLATRHARTAAELSLVSGVATSYLALAADGELLTLSRSTLASNESSLDLIAQSRDLGVATDLDLNQARSLVESARAEVARLEGNVRTDRNALTLLVGEPVPAELLPLGLSAVQPIAGLRPGMRSDVLLARPDILAAEESLIAANASIGAARAAFFPRVTLLAGTGTLSPEVSSLFGSGTGGWSFVPQIVAPIFAGGALKANLAATRATRNIAVAQYEQSIQRAFAEVANAISDQTTLATQRTAVEALVVSLEETHRLAKARYEAGIDSYLQVLVVERSLFAARQQLVGLRFAQENNRVTLFKVLAGESKPPEELRPADTGPATEL